MSRFVHMARTGLALLRKPDIVPVMPLHFQLEPAVGCNLTCRTCNVPRLREHGVMPLERFVDIFDQVRPLKIGLSGAGEPFLNKDMVKMVRHAREGGASVLTTTNFTLCHDQLDDLVTSGLDLVKVSLDAATPATYARIRGRDCFADILADLRALQEIKRRRGVRTPFIRLQFVIQHDNLDEIVPMIDLARDLGAEAVYYQPLVTVLVPDMQEELTRDITRRLLEERLAAAQRRAREAGVGTNAGVLLGSLDQHFRKYGDLSGNPPDRVCLMPWFSVYITVNGDVQVCCCFASTRMMIMGNAFDEPFAKVWNNARFQAIRRASRQRTLRHPVCRSCTPNRLRDFVSLSAVLPGWFGRK